MMPIRRYFIVRVKQGKFMHREKSSFGLFVTKIFVKENGIAHCGAGDRASCYYLKSVLPFRQGYEPLTEWSSPRVCTRTPLAAR
jgi:hypothetical protein